MRVSDAERRRVHDAIGRAEIATSAEFVCVLAQRSSRYESYALGWAAVLALAAPWLLLHWVPWPFKDLLLAQLAVFAVVFAGMSLPQVRRWIVPRKAQRAAAHRAAAEQFLIRDLANTPHRRGILLFVSQDEHYARVLADDGVASAVPEDAWRQAVALLIEGASAERHSDGFVAALDHCGALLASRFPPEATRANALADKFYVLG